MIKNLVAKKGQIYCLILLKWLSPMQVSLGYNHLASRAGLLLEAVGENPSSIMQNPKILTFKDSESCILTTCNSDFLSLCSFRYIFNFNIVSIVERDVLPMCASD